MLNWIKNLFTGTTVPTPLVVDTKVEAANSAPYKVPAPAAITPIPLVVTPKKKPAVKKTPANTCNFDKLTKTQLLAEAKHRSVKASASMSKTDILAAVKGAK
jgi:hypothetical protein